MAKINSKEIQKSLADDVKARKDGTSKMKNFSDAVDSASSKVKSNALVVEKLKMSYQQQIEAGEDSAKVFMELTKAQKEASDAVKDLNVAERDKENFDIKYQQESMAALDRIGNNILKVSPEELETRKIFQKSLDIEKEQAALLRADPLRQDQADKADANIKVKEEKEVKRREDANTNIFKKGFAYLGNAFENFKENAMKAGVTALKGGLLVLLYFAISQFLQSPLFMQIINFFSTGGPLMIALKVAGVILTGFIAKFLLGKALGILGNKLLIMSGLIKKSGMDVSKISKSMGKKGFARGISLLGKGLTGIKGSLLRAGTLLSGKLVAMGSVLKVGLLTGIKFIGVAIAKGAAAILGFLSLPVVLTIAAVALAAALIYSYWDEISGFFSSVGTYVSDAISNIGAKLGSFFSDLFKPVTDLFIRIKNAMAGYYNSVATSAFGKFIGMTPLDVDGPPSATEAPQFVKNLQGPTVADRADKMRVADSATQYVINNNAVNSVSTTGPTVQQNSTRYVKDQGGVFASNNA